MGAVTSVDVEILRVEDVYTDEAVRLLEWHPEWTLADLERECERRGITAKRPRPRGPYR